MHSAQPADAALSRPLFVGGDGPEVAIKECLAIKGIVTRCGSRALAEGPVADENAAVVDALLARGCHIIGTANMHELAFGVTGVNAFLGTPVNAKWPDRIPGGSSSGSAALVAAGRCDFAVGTDTGGSVRMPACCCGVFGMKPTYGRISRAGAIPAESSLDCIGPFAATAKMLTKAMSLMDPSFAARPPATEFRLGRIAVSAEPQIVAAFERALAGVRAAEITLEHFEAAYEAGLVIINAEAADAFAALAHEDNGMDETVRARILAAEAGRLDADISRAEEIRLMFRSEVDHALEDCDALVLPTMPVVPPLLADAVDMRALIPLTALVRPFNLSGHPAITIPILTEDGLPAGVQLVGRIGGDEALCAIAEGLAATIDINPEAFAGDKRNGH
ncbi:amidase [Martelella lutilitoris]|uniref:Indoleacetamide hydrolase n=1 Tax=Martelella lutilitoris TaxID=2583532 RepID=A0A5C4JTF0_9HYPH|nr:amidase [Martelella lutilitoris]TNB48522.1 amidase [Martelella lutilitoris]